MDGDQELFLGIDLGGTKILSGVVSGSGRVLAADYRKTKAKRGPAAVVARIIKSARTAVAEAGVRMADIQAIGVGAPGPVDVQAGEVTAPPNLQGWERVPLRHEIETVIGLPTFLENDANAAALGENLYGAGRGTSHMLYVTVSTGIGGGFILNGRLYTGAAGMAGEVGHMTIVPDGPPCGCGNRGCLEALASGTAIAHQGRELLQSGSSAILATLAAVDSGGVTAKMVAKAARQGDANAISIVAAAMQYLGIGIANLVKLLDPELVVIGGSLTKLGNSLFDPVNQAIQSQALPQHSRRVGAVPAELGDEVGLRGAASVALRGWSEMRQGRE